MTGDDPVRVDEAMLQQPGDHRLGHDAGADERKPRSG
jgi:hypothetical protein